MCCAPRPAPPSAHAQHGKEMQALEAKVRALESELRDWKAKCHEAERERDRAVKQAREAGREADIAARTEVEELR